MITNLKMDGVSSEPSDLKNQRRLRFNIGGTYFHTFRETIQNSNVSRLADENFLAPRYDYDQDEFFFDRDAEMFRSVLNFHRSGRLHLPPNICGPVVKEELEFWGVEEGSIEACCWTNYNGWNSTIRALEQLERDRKQHVQLELDESASCLARAKQTTWLFLTVHSSSLGAKIYGWLSLCFVLISIISFCAATHPYFKATPAPSTNSSNTTENPGNQDSQHSFETDTARHPVLFYIDIVCLVFFTIEYILRFVCAPRKLKYLISPLSIIDLLAIMPDYIEFIIYAADAGTLQEDTFVNFMPLLRLMRAFRIFRLIRHVPGLWIMFYTLKASFKDLFLMLVFLLVGMLLSSALIYYTDDKTTFTSIPHGFWWAVVTMTTVGYGDMYPTTPLGRLVGSFTAVCGVLLIGFTIPALVNNFSLYYQHVEFALQKERAQKEQQRKSSKFRKEKISKCGHECKQDAYPEHIPLCRLANKNSGL